MKKLKTGIDWSSELVSEAILGKDVSARQDLSVDISDFFGEIMNAAPDPNLAGQPSRELGVSGIGEAALIDFKYQDIFRETDLRQSTSETHEIVNVASGISFEQIVAGEEVKVRSVTSSNRFIKALIHAAGLGFSDRWLRYNQFYKFEESTLAAVRKYGATMANAHYSLFKALPASVDVAFNSTVENTIDTACASILETIGDDFGLDDGAEFKILVNRRNASLVNKALAAQFGNPNNNNGQIASNVAPAMVTSNVNIEASVGGSPVAYVVLPEHTLQTPVWQDLHAEESRDASKAGTDIFYRGEFNAAIGDSRQIKRIRLA